MTEVAKYMWPRSEKDGSHHSAQAQCSYERQEHESMLALLLNAQRCNSMNQPNQWKARRHIYLAELNEKLGAIITYKNWPTVGFSTLVAIEYNSICIYIYDMYIHMYKELYVR